MKLAIRRAPLLREKLVLNSTLPNFEVAKRVGEDGKLTESCPREKEHEPVHRGARPVGMGRPAYPLVLGPRGPSSAGLCVSRILAYVVKRTS
jgi:hypothetical protein